MVSGADITETSGLVEQCTFHELGTIISRMYEQMLWRSIPNNVL